MRRLISLVTLIFAGLCSFVVPPVYGAQRGRAEALPPGTKVEIRLNSQLHTGETHAGQAFTGTVSRAVVVNGRTVLARGTSVQGRVTEVASSGRLKRPASITLELSGSGLATEPLRVDGKSHLVRNAALIGGGAGAGALIGGLAGGKKGAAVGAAVGAGAGTATAYITGKDEIVLPAETLLPFVVRSGGGSGMTASSPRQAPAAGRAPQQSEAYREDDEDRRGARRDREEMEMPVFSERERGIILGYYGGRGGGRGLPPGLAKRGGHLPPGLERHLEKNGTLPPGLQKRVEPFPPELERRLPRLPTGYLRVIVEGRAIILGRGNVIVDLLHLGQ